MYANADIYIIDDSLSALDAHVSKSIFENVFIKELKNNGKTLLFITHALHYAEKADKVCVIKDGTIIENDTPQNLKAN